MFYPILFIHTYKQKYFLTFFLRIKCTVRDLLNIYVPFTGNNMSYYVYMLNIMNFNDLNNRENN